MVQKEQEEIVYIVASELLESVSKTLNCNLRVLETISGKQLGNSTYFHPIYKEQILSLLPAAHATLKGTGLVHTAPAHGPEDFLVALENKLPVVKKNKNCFYIVFKLSQFRFVWLMKLVATHQKQDKT